MEICYCYRVVLGKKWLNTRYHSVQTLYYITTCQKCGKSLIERAIEVFVEGG